MIGKSHFIYAETSHIDLFASSECPFCNNLKEDALLFNCLVPAQNEIPIVYDDIGEPKVQKLVHEFGNLVPLPATIKEGKIREIITGTYSNTDDNILIFKSLITR